jgi:hypothetical protein
VRGATSTIPTPTRPTCTSSRAASCPGWSCPTARAQFPAMYDDFAAVWPAEQLARFRAHVAEHKADRARLSGCPRPPRSGTARCP